MSFTEDVLDLIFPPECLICRTEGHWWCQQTPPPWPRCLNCDAPYIYDQSGRCRHNQPLFAVGHYDGPLREAIHRYKYTGYWAISRDWAKGISATISSVAQPGDQLVPIPLHWTRQLRRGYNQAEIFARYLSRFTKLEVAQILKRHRRTRPQIELETEARASNLHGALSTRIKNQPSSVWLVDDISTSGATLKEARRVLRAAGFTVRGAIVIGLAK